MHLIKEVNSLQEINSKKLNKTNLVIFIIIAVIIISVLGYIVFQTLNKSETEENTKQSNTLSATKEVTTVAQTTKKPAEPPTTIIPKTEQPTQSPVKDSSQDLKQKLLNMQFDRMIGEDTPCLLTFTSENTLKYEFGEKYTYSYTIEGNVLTLLDVYWDGNKMPLSYTITIKDDVYYNSTKCTELYLEPRANAGPIAGKWVSGL